MDYRPVATMGNANSLADILERVLDKGVVIAGDIQIKLADVELLTIKIRLLIASVDKAMEIGIDWWRTDPHLSSQAALAAGLAPSALPEPPAPAKKRPRRAQKRAAARPPQA